MADQWGRPVMGDFMRVANMFNQAADRRRDMEQRSRIDNYLGRMQRGEEIDTGAADYSAMDHAAASAVAARSILQDEQLRQVRLKNDTVEAEQRQARLTEAVARAEMIYNQARQAKTPDARQRLEQEAYDALLPAYEYMPDGGTNARWNADRSKLIVTDRASGKDIEAQAPAFERALFAAKTQSASYVRDAVERREGERRMATELALKAFTDPEHRWRTESGKEAVMVPVPQRNDYGDTVWREALIDPQSGQVLAGFDYQSGEVVGRGDHGYRAPAYWKSVAALSTEQRKSWEKAVGAASKAWASNLKEGAVDAGSTDQGEWELNYALGYYKRLSPGAPLPAGVVDAAGAGAGESWAQYLPPDAATGIITEPPGVLAGVKNIMFGGPAHAAAIPPADGLMSARESSGVMDTMEAQEPPEATAGQPPRAAGVAQQALPDPGLSGRGAMGTPVKMATGRGIGGEQIAAFGSRNVPAAVKGKAPGELMRAQRGARPDAAGSGQAKKSEYRLEKDGTITAEINGQLVTVARAAKKGTPQYELWLQTLQNVGLYAEAKKKKLV